MSSGPKSAESFLNSWTQYPMIHHHRKPIRILLKKQVVQKRVRTQPPPLTPQPATRRTQIPPPTLAFYRKEAEVRISKIEIENSEVYRKISRTDRISIKISAECSIRNCLRPINLSTGSTFSNINSTPIPMTNHSMW